MASIKVFSSHLDSTVHKSPLNLPRILCLHGGGSNARIFRAQTRALRHELSSHFRFVFVDAPFSSEPGPDVTSAYESFGPFRRWLRSGPHHPDLNPNDAVSHVEEAIYDTMDRDDLLGATGSYVAVLGFSQGAKMAASLLFRQQVRTQKLGRGFAGTAFHFAIVIAGRGPLVSMDPELCMTPALLDMAQVNLEQPPSVADLRRGEHVLRLPTIHVHGLQDPGLPLHQRLLREYCGREARLIEWDGGHRMPIKSKDVAPLVQAVLDLAQETGVLKRKSAVTVSVQSVSCEAMGPESCGMVETIAGDFRRGLRESVY